MKTVLGWRASPTTVSVTFDDGIPHIIASDHKHFDEIVHRLRTGAEDGLRELISPRETVLKFASDRIEIRGSTLFYKGEQLHNTIVDVILEMVAEGHDPSVTIAFLDRLMQNPSYNSRQQLWKFIEQNGVVLYDGAPIPLDGEHAGQFAKAKGWLVLYKGVNENYTDCHTGKFLNTVGTWQHMDRTRVDDNPNASCSVGFHAGDYSYVNSFGHRKMVVLVDPADVCSVPHDSNATKVRVSDYYVLSEVPRTEFKDFTSSVYEPEEFEEPEEADEYRYIIEYEDGTDEIVSAVDFDDARKQADATLDVISISLT